MKDVPGKHVVAVDLDGTLAHHDPDEEYDPSKIGEPVKPMMDKVKSLIDNGHEVRIHTARVGESGAFPHIKAWLREQGLPDLKITNRKDSDVSHFYDDRAIAVERNTGKVLGGEEPEMDWEEEARKSIK